MVLKEKKYERENKKDTLSTKGKNDVKRNQGLAMGDVVKEKVVRVYRR